MEDWRDPFELVNADGRSSFALVCEHASNWMPSSYARLGLPETELQRHIAWDIGAADLARGLSLALDAPLILATASRLLIDLNRPPGSATSIPELSEATRVPGNCGLDDEERKRRANRWFYPFQDAVGALLDRRQERGRLTRLLAIHSFTPVFLGQVRPWQAGILYRRSAALGAHLVERLGGEAAAIAHNQPYQIDDESDFTIPIHGEARGLDAVLVEVRQDLIATADGAAHWADRLAGALGGL